MSDKKRVKYERYYSLFLKQDVHLFLSYSSWFWRWAYLYKNAKALWFTKVKGGSEGAVKTGDLVYIKSHAFGKRWLYARGTGDRTASWELSGGEALEWRIWQDLEQKSGLDIYLDDTVVFTNEKYGRHVYLVQQQKYPTYVGLSSEEHPYKWQIRDSDGKVPKDDQEEAAALPQPPDAATGADVDPTPPDDPYDVPRVDT